MRRIIALGLISLMLLSVDLAAPSSPVSAAAKKTKKKVLEKAGKARPGNSTLTPSDKVMVSVPTSTTFALVTTTVAPTTSTVSTVVPHLPTGPGLAAPPEATAILNTDPTTKAGTTIARRTFDPLGVLPSDLTPQEYVEAVLGWTEKRSVRRKAVDLAALRTRVEAVTAGATSTAQTYPALSAYLALLGDGHSSLYGPNEARSLLEGKARGFGFTLVTGYLFPFPGSPAELAGMRDRDRLVAINGVPYTSGTRLSGIPDKSTFDVTRVDTNGGLETTASLVVSRGDIVTSLKPKARVFTSTAGTDSDIGVVELPGSTGSRNDELDFVKQGLTALRDVDAKPRCGWVLDLRRNSGGFATSMIAAVAPLYGDGIFAGFLDAAERVSWLSIQGAAVLVDGRVEATGTLDVRLAHPKAPIAVLTGPVTASAAELAIIGLVGRGGVRVFGEPTVGVTSGNLGRSYPDGSFVAVTSVYDVDRLGRVYDGPLQPDEAIRNDWSRFGSNDDPALVAATTWLKGQTACSVVGS